jgi:large subunit ribosomal protein L21
VLRVTGITAGGKETKWDGEVSLTTKAELDARARGLDFATLNVLEEGAKSPQGRAAEGRQGPAKARPRR